mmetsp:Transcript_40520/g.56300  ORF Transcript_40520/g.56300 Transcript_40520/m.56300 type:complete len:214 (+) Transcript_40520:37-678(+)
MTIALTCIEVKNFLFFFAITLFKNHVQTTSASSTKALQLMQDCAKIPSSAGFVSQGWTFRDMAGFAEEMLDIGVNLLRSGVRGEWPKLSSSGQPQQPFPTDDRLLLLKSKFGDSEGDAIFNKYCKDSTMALLQPSAFLTESQLLGKSSFAKESLRQKFTFVLFVGWRKPDLSSDQELWDVEDGLLADIQSEKNIHMFLGGSLEWRWIIRHLCI